jgi:hypothetical protein
VCASWWPAAILNWNSCHVLVQHLRVLACLHLQLKGGGGWGLVHSLAVLLRVQDVLEHAAGEERASGEDSMTSVQHQQDRRTSPQRQLEKNRYRCLVVDNPAQPNMQPLVRAMC